MWEDRLSCVGYTKTTASSLSIERLKVEMVSLPSQQVNPDAHQRTTTANEVRTEFLFALNQVTLNA